MPADSPGDAVTAALLQITQHAERLAVLDEREAAHYQELTARLTELARLLTETSGHVADVNATTAKQSALLDSLDGLDQQVADLTSRLTEITPVHDSKDDQDGERYQPSPAPPWWKLSGEEQQEAIGRLRAWVEQVYRPGYGHLAAALAPAGNSTRSASTGSTGSWNFGPSSTSPAHAAHPSSPARPNGRPGCCPPSPSRCTSKPPAASTRGQPLPENPQESSADRYTEPAPRGEGRPRSDIPPSSPARDRVSKRRGHSTRTGAPPDRRRAQPSTSRRSRNTRNGAEAQLPDIEPRPPSTRASRESRSASRSSSATQRDRTECWRPCCCGRWLS
jgi:hypothetical protein